MILSNVRPPTLLLDTCAIIYLFNGEVFAKDAMEAVDAASVLVSPISAWEVGILGRKNSPTVPVSLPDPAAWFKRVLAAPFVSAAPFDADIALSSRTLPEPLHRDPADRFLIASARTLAVPIVTRDHLILAYAAAGHVDAIAC